MRVDAVGKPGYAGPATSTRRAGGGTFAVAEDAGAPAAAQTSAPRPVATLAALIALQEFEEPAERRRRAIKRGRSALDALDELKIGVLAGHLDPAVLARLKAATEGAQDPSGDPRLDAILAEVELRAAVELAKLSASAGQKHGS